MFIIFQVVAGYLLIGLGWAGWRLSVILIAIHKGKNPTELKFRPVFYVFMSYVLVWPYDAIERVIFTIKRM